MLKRVVTALVLALLLVLAPSGQARADNDVILQGFYWDVPEDWYRILQADVPELARAGFTSIWLPPPSAGAAGRWSMGYDLKDHYNLGDELKGETPTRFGTLKELQDLVWKLGEHEISAIADINLAHMTGGQEEDLPWGGKGWTKFENPSFPLNHEAFDFTPREWKFGENLNHANNYVRHGLKEWGDWLTRVVGYKGFRFDQAKELEPGFVREWLGHGAMWNKPGVGEFFDTDMAKLDAWSQASGAKVFDFPLFFTLREMANDQSGGFDMRRLSGAGYAARNPWGAVTFAENHDTDRGQPISFDKAMAYAYIMAMEGQPTVFYKDYKDYGLKDVIDPLMAIRKTLAGGTTSTLWADDHLFVAQRNGADGRPGLVLVMNNSPTEWKGQWVTVKGDWAGLELKDHTGSAIPRRVAADGRVELWAPPRGYAIYAPEVAGFDALASNRARDDKNRILDENKGALPTTDLPAVTKAGPVSSGEPIKVAAALRDRGPRTIGMTGALDGAHDTLKDRIHDATAGAERDGVR